MWANQFEMFSEMLDIAYVNNVGIIAKNPKMTAINSAIEVDLTGQVCSDSIGTRMYSGSLKIAIYHWNLLFILLLTFAGFGGQVDFIRGAAEGFDGKGKPIIALPSVTKRNETKIVPTVKLGMTCFSSSFWLIHFLKFFSLWNWTGGGIVTSRAHVHYVVTEFGIAYLLGKSLRQRAHALINVSHPDHRESLEKAAFERLKCMPSA